MVLVEAHAVPGQGQLAGGSLAVSGGPVLLVNPPSPRGFTANREGFGGLGVLVPGRRGFVYPAQRLAEAAAALHLAGIASTGADHVVAPWRARAAMARAPRGASWIVLTSARTLAFDLAWIEKRLPAGAPLILAAPALEALEPIARRGTRIPVCGGPAGFAAAALFRGGAPVADSGGSEPFARWDVIPLGRKRRLPVYHARGCFKPCTYCPYVLATGRRLQSRTVARTVEEWRFQCARHRPRRVVFRDPVFGIQPEASIELLEQIAALPASQRAPLEIETRADLLDEPLARALKDAGCVEVKLGVETYDPGRLEQTRRVDSAAAAEDYVRRAREGRAILHRLGIPCRPYFMEWNGGGATDDVSRPSTELPSVRSPLSSPDPVLLAQLSGRENRGLPDGWSWNPDAGAGRGADL